MNKRFYNWVLMVFVFIYPIFMVVYQVSSLMSQELGASLLQAEIIGGNNGPTSLMIVEGQRPMSLIPDVIGMLLLFILVAYRKLFPRHKGYLVISILGMCLWLFSILKYVQWLS